MYLKRKIDDYLLEWKKNMDRLPLIIKGARQIGKTESINQFAMDNYKNVVNINFALEPKYKTILSDGYSVCLLYTSPSPRDGLLSRMPSSA